MLLGRSGARRRFRTRSSVFVEHFEQVLDQVLPLDELVAEGALFGARDLHLQPRQVVLEEAPQELRLAIRQAELHGLLLSASRAFNRSTAVAAHLRALFG